MSPMTRVPLASAGRPRGVSRETESLGPWPLGFTWRLATSLPRVETVIAALRAELESNLKQLGKRKPAPASGSKTARLPDVHVSGFRPPHRLPFLDIERL